MSYSVMDVMSSPDPLNASLDNSAMMSSRRVTRSQSQASSRLSSVNPSPRKQTFALDVGNERSPQKIIVTVEADDGDAHNSNVKRKLFQSPTPRRVVRRREKTTTTTVPLKGLTDDESGVASSSVAPTPKRRGRPSKSGTPAATARKRATPIRKTPRQPRRTKASQAENLTSEISIDDPDATPRAKRTRTGVKRKNGTPAKEAGQTPQPKRRGRRQRSMTAEEIMVLGEQTDNTDAEGENNGSVGDNASVAGTEDHISVAGGYAPAPPSDNGADEDDIWMATLSDAPQFSRRESSAAQETDEVEQDQARLPSVDRRTETDEDGSEANVDHGATGGYSETESLASDVNDKNADKDTIMVQEEFTMISVNSLPSMQGSLSVAASQHEIGEETSLIISQTLESMRQSHNEPRPKTPYEDQISLVGPSPQNDQPLEPPSSSLFTQSISAPSWGRSPRRTKAQDLARQLAVKSLQRQQGPESPQRHQTEAQPIAQANAEESMYDDSFSEIPEEVLEAATPRPTRRAMIQEQDDTEPAIQLSIERSSRVNPPNSQSDSNRLLTPDETPSPLPSEHDDEKDMQSAAREHVVAEMQSSPPVVNFQRELSEPVSRSSRRASSATPVPQVPSSRSPRVDDAKIDAQHLAPPDSAPRPTLSPIVRAGRALQLVTSDPPSTPAKEPSLGSPFRASVSKSPALPMATTQPAPAMRPTFTAPMAASQQRVARQPAAAPEPAPAPAVETLQEPPPAEERQKSPWSSAFAPFKQIKNLVAQGAQVFSPKAAPPPAVEDPFVAAPGTDNSPARQDTLTMHNSMFSLGGGSMNRASRTSSVQAEVAYEDEMSWQAEGTPVRIDERLTSASSTMRARRGSMAEMSDVDMESLVEESIMEDDDNEQEEQDDEFDDDIWAVEAQRPTPGPSQPQALEREPVLDPPRRGKLPSPWRQNSKRLVYSDELHKLASDKDEEFSLLSQFSGKEPVVEQPAQLPKKVDLSAFFSSPALLPEVQPYGISLPKPGGRPLARQMETGPTVTSGLSRLTNPPAATELESQPRQPLPVSRKIFPFGGRSGGTPSNLAGAPSLPSVPQKDLQIGTPRRVDLFSPVKPASREGGPEAAAHSSSPSTPPRQLFAHVPQKRNFTPRSGQAGNSLFAPISAGGPVEAPSSQRDDAFTEQENETEETLSPAHHSSSPTQDSSFIAPVLKPLPSRAQSPTKSCIRSPLKPKTPGRVVEFTSSTLSPLAQAQARAEQRAHSSLDKVQAGKAGKENLPQHDGSHDMPPTAATSNPNPFSSIPRLPPPTTSLPRPASRLSPQTWTRAHWERLDALLQQRRSTGALAFQLAHPVAKNATRPRLLGKQVIAQGETMVLEQWHLDVVDAFAAEVGGGSVWDERVLAKRVFALLVGEERRRKGLVERRRKEGDVFV